MEVEWIHFKEIPSTHNYMVEHAGEFDRQKLTCLTASTQTAGRGRYENRPWVSKEGNLLLSLFLACDPQPNLAQLMAFSALEVIGQGAKIKWPNDLLHEGKKFCGTLAESAGSGMVVSIGINVNTPVSTDQPVTSLKEITHRDWDLDELKKALVFRFIHNFSKGFSQVATMFEKHLAYRDQEIAFLLGEKKISGTLLGITEEGFLRLLVDGVERDFSSGEIKSTHIGDDH